MKQPCLVRSVGKTGKDRRYFYLSTNGIRIALLESRRISTTTLIKTPKEIKYLWPLTQLL